jgi:hypothetical protein
MSSERALKFVLRAFVRLRRVIVHSAKMRWKIRVILRA